ncbi:MULTISPECIES: hypothetical protein [unclassified Microcoleus]|uniref:hypothetical protein n=1 Tax=unclassified Microcoleus TaxID=2642155 RepID=UPI002FD52768
MKTVPLYRTVGKLEIAHLITREFLPQMSADIRGWTRIIVDLGLRAIALCLNFQKYAANL